VGLVNQNIVVGGLLTVAVLLIFLRSGRSDVTGATVRFHLFRDRV